MSTNNNAAVNPFYIPQHDNHHNNNNNNNNDGDDDDDDEDARWDNWLDEDDHDMGDVELSEQVGFLTRDYQNPDDSDRRHLEDTDADDDRLNGNYDEEDGRYHRRGRHRKGTVPIVDYRLGWYVTVGVVAFLFLLAISSSSSSSENGVDQKLVEALTNSSSMENFFEDTAINHESDTDSQGGDHEQASHIENATTPIQASATDPPTSSDGADATSLDEDDNNGNSETHDHDDTGVNNTTTAAKNDEHEALPTSSNNTATMKDDDDSGDGGDGGDATGIDTTPSTEASANNEGDGPVNGTTPEVEEDDSVVEKSDDETIDENAEDATAGNEESIPTGSDGTTTNTTGAPTGEIDDEERRDDVKVNESSGDTNTSTVRSGNGDR